MSESARPAAIRALGELPGEVRSRVVALTADVLPAVPRLPAPLVRVADFAPARRARLGATAIASALDADDDFRERVAVQLGVKLPAGDVTDVPAEADPVEVGALAWLVRPEGWPAILEGALTQLAERTSSNSAKDEVERWRTKAQGAEQALRDARAQHRDELAAAKAENNTLRRRLGEARAALREATAASEDAAATVERARREAEATIAAQERELRQMRARVERLEAEAQRERRTARADRDEATLRARLLLDTVIDAASGLRRELSLPGVPGAPGDRIEATLDAGTEGGATTPALTPTSPTVLEQLLAMPRSRLIVDGYNVSKTAWPSSSLEAQRNRLVNGLAPLVARTGAETTVVFDAAATSTRPVVAAPRGVKVRFSPEGVIADDVIRDLVAAEPAGRVVVVVTSDQAVARDVARAGARAVAADALLGLLNRAG